MMEPLPLVNHHAPLEIGKDTHLIRSVFGEHGAPMKVYVNSLVIAGPEPIVVDTGVVVNREQWLADVSSIVDLEDVKWVFLSHDDHDHIGNLEQILEAAPNATLVGNWFMTERLAGDLSFPLERMRWIDDDQSFDAGGRTLAVIRPPLYDSPTTRGLFDPASGVYWAVDAFAAPMLEVVENVGDLDSGFWDEGFSMFNRGNSPWSVLVDPVKFGAQVARIERLGATVIANAHSPVIDGANVAEAFAKMRQIPYGEEPVLPGQADLDQILAAIAEAQAA